MCQVSVDFTFEFKKQETRTEWVDLHILAIWANNGLLEHRLQVRLHMYLFYVQY